MGIDPKKVSGLIRRPLLHRDIQYAQSQTKSHAEAARYLNVSFTTYKRWARMYDLYENEHKNAAGKGVTKHRTKGLFGLDEILAGKHPNYDRGKLKERLIAAGYLKAECDLCGHTETRPDGKGPFVLHYRSGNTKDLSLDNLALRCYNCTYLTTGVVAIGPSNNAAFGAGSFSQDVVNVLGKEELESLRDELSNTQLNDNEFI